MSTAATTINPIEREAELHAELRRLSAKRGAIATEQAKLAAERDRLRAARDRELRRDKPDTIAIDDHLAAIERQLGRPGMQSLDPRLGGVPPVLGDLQKRIQYVAGEEEQIREQIIALHVEHRDRFRERSMQTAEAEVEAARAAAAALRQYVAAHEANVAQWRDTYIGTPPEEVERGVYGASSHLPGSMFEEGVDTSELGQRSRGKYRATVPAVIERLAPVLEALDALPPIERAPRDAYADHVAAIHGDSIDGKP